MAHMPPINIHKRTEEFNPNKHKPPKGKEIPRFIKKKPFIQTKKRFNIPDTILETAKAIDNKAYFVLDSKLIEQEFNINRDLLDMMIKYKGFKQINNTIYIPYLKRDFFEEIHKMSLIDKDFDFYTSKNNPIIFGDLLNSSNENLVNNNVKNLKINYSGTIKFNIINNADFLINNSSVTKTNWDLYKNQKIVNEPGCLIMGSYALVNLINFSGGLETELINDTLKVKKFDEVYKIINPNEFTCLIDFLNINYVDTAIFENIDLFKNSLKINNFQISKVRPYFNKMSNYGDALFVPVNVLEDINSMFYFVDFNFKKKQFE